MLTKHSLAQVPATRMSRVALAGLIAGSLVSGCDNVVQPTTASTTAARSVAVAPQSEPFYYASGRKIYLEVDSSKMIVSSTSDAAIAALPSILAAVGARMVASQPLGAEPRHYVLNLAESSPAALLHAIERIVSDGRFDFVAPRYTTVATRSPVVLVNNLDVQFKPDVTTAKVDSVMRATGLRLIRPPFPDSGYFAYRFAYPRGTTTGVLELAAAIHDSPLVLWSSPGMITDLTPASVPNDPYYSQQWYLKNTTTTHGGIPVDLAVEGAWDVTTGAGLRVAVIDAGVDIKQGNLGGSYSGDLSTGQFGGASAKDEFAFTPGEDAFTPACNDQHGTAVTGLIMASRNNGIGMAGIAPNSVLISARIYRYLPVFNLPSGGTPCPKGFEAVDLNRIADAINWAWQYAHADVINLSWTLNVPNDALRIAIQNAATMGRGGLGTVVVASAGNCSQRSQGLVCDVMWPARYSGDGYAIVSVGAIDQTGGVADYSAQSFDVGLDVVALGSAGNGDCVTASGVLSLDLVGTPGCNTLGTELELFGGTSAAAAEVSGVAALIMSAHPTWTADQVKIQLRQSADPWGAYNNFGFGKVNAARAVGPVQ